ncbi:MAG: 4Fe-4S binding protein [Thermoleophilia bacterium]
MSSGIAMAQRPSITRVPVFDSRRCKQCGLCAYVCPVGALEVPARSAPLLPQPEACSGCRNCEFICPDFAVSMTDALLAHTHVEAAI